MHSICFIGNSECRKQPIFSIFIQPLTFPLNTKLMKVKLNLKTSFNEVAMTFVRRLGYHRAIHCHGMDFDGDIIPKSKWHDHNIDI